jgi:hypothetical protein
MRRPTALWRAQYSTEVTGQMMAAGSSANEKLPGEVAGATNTFF